MMNPEMREDIATGLVVAEEEVAGAGPDAVGVVQFWMLQGRRSGDCMAKVLTMDIVCSD